MNIIKLEKTDIKNALELIWNVFSEFEAPEYSEQGITTFKEFIQYDAIIAKVEKGELFLWGCFVGKDLAGVITTRGLNHICLLFVKKEYHRQGIAKRLFHTIVDLSKSERGKKITVHSSRYAVEVYHRLGFRDTGPERVEDGLRFTPMEYVIS